MNNKSELLSQLKIDRDEPSELSTRWPWVVGFLLLALLILGLIWLMTSPPAIPVSTQVARMTNERGTANSVLNATGYVAARRYATVSSKVTAKVVEVLVEEGMTVQEGQIVARLDDSDTLKLLAVEQAGLDAARAQLAETQTRLSEAERIKHRADEMFRKKLLSEAELDVVTSNYQSLQAQLEARRAQALSAQRRVELQQQYLDDMTLRAPFSGVVVSKDAQPGEIISPVSAGGGFTRTGICSLVDMESLEIEVDVNESYIDRIRANQPAQATLEAYPDWKIPARVLAIVPTADRQKATVRVRVGFLELDPRILPDMGIKVAFFESETASPDDTKPLRQAIVVPRNAVQQVGNDAFVFAVQGSTVQQRNVEIEVRNDGEYWLLSGLEPGEHFVVNPPPTLEDRATIIIE